MNTKNSLKKVALSGLLVLLFAGCGSNGDSGGTEPIVLAPTIYAPTTTINNKTNVTVRGEVNSIVYVNGEKTNIKIGDNGTATVELETKEIGITTFIIITENSSGQRSEPINVTINRVTEDITKPVITINGNSTISITQGTPYTDAGATAEDNVDGVVKVNVSGSVDSSKVGTYTLTYTATDKAGNKATATRKVIVKENSLTVDTTKPIISILGDNPVSVVQNATYKDAGATAKDNVDGVVKVNVSGSVDSSKVGTYTLTYTATDKAGNKAIATRKVIVKENAATVDTTKPIISILGDNPASVVQNATYKDAGARAKDNVDGVVKVNVSGSVDSSKVGTYTITYTATDKAGNKATKTREVQVVLPADTTPPVITVTGDNPLKITQGETFSDPGATATDNRDDEVKVTPTGTVDMDTVGNYTITYTATDKAGNKATATRTIHVVLPADTIAPVITITGGSPLELTQGETFSYPGATAIDNVDGNVSVISSGSVDTSTVGTYTLTYTATDKAGNEATETRTVNVVSDLMPPAFPFN